MVLVPLFDFGLGFGGVSTPLLDSLLPGTKITSSKTLIIHQVSISTQVSISWWGRILQSIKYGYTFQRVEGSCSDFIKIFQTRMQCGLSVTVTD